MGNMTMPKNMSVPITKFSPSIFFNFSTFLLLKSSMVPKISNLFTLTICSDTLIIRHIIINTVMHKVIVVTIRHLRGESGTGILI